MEEFLHHLGCIKSLNNETNYQPQLVIAGFLNHQQYHFNLSRFSSWGILRKTYDYSLRRFCFQMAKMKKIQVDHSPSTAQQKGPLFVPDLHYSGTRENSPFCGVPTNHSADWPKNSLYIWLSILSAGKRHQPGFCENQLYELPKNLMTKTDLPEPWN